MSGVEIGVTEPETDHVDVVSCAQQVHRGGVPYEMGIDWLGFAPGAFWLCLYSVLTGHMADAKAGNGDAVGVEEKPLRARFFRGTLFAIGFQGSDGLGPQGTGAFLVALAMQGVTCAALSRRRSVNSRVTISLTRAPVL